MRGPDAFNKARFTTVRPEDFVPANDPLRPIRQWVDEALARNPNAVECARPGHKKEKASFGFLMGAVMKASGGKANPKVVQEILAKKLAAIHGG